MRRAFQIQELGLYAVLALAATGPWGTYRHLVPGLLIPVFLTGSIIGLAVLYTLLRRKTVVVDAPIIAMSAYWLLVFFSHTWTINPEAWPTYVAWWAICLAAFFGVRNFVRTRHQLRLFVYACAAAVVLTLPQLSTAVYAYMEDAARYSVEGHNANLTAYVLAGCGYSIILAMLFLRFSSLQKLALIGVLALIGYELMLLDTRGAQLSLMLTAAVALVVKRTPRSLRIFGSVALVLGAFLQASGAFTPLLLWIDSFSGRSTGDLSGRLVLWSEAYQQIAANPVLGIGPGAFPTVSSLGIGAHNIFLTILLDTGFVGLALLLLMLATVVASIMRRTGDYGSMICLLFLCYLLPIVTSGHAELIPFSWLAIGFTINVARTQRARGIVTPAPIAVEPALKAI